MAKIDGANILKAALKKFERATETRNLHGTLNEMIQNHQSYPPIEQHAYKSIQPVIGLGASKSAPSIGNLYGNCGNIKGKWSENQENSGAEHLKNARILPLTG
jgi:hypothetical protein